MLSSKGSAPAKKSTLITCFLIQEGADPYIVNNKGSTALSIGSTDNAALLTLVIEQKHER